MAFLGNLLKRFTKFKDAAAEARKRMNPFVQTSVDPMLSWENVGEIGDGAFGKVHRAVSKNDGREAALKQILLESEEDMEDLMVEIDILVSCRHENIVQLYEAYHHDNRLWLYLEFCAGGALDTIMHELDRPLSEVQIRHVGHYVVQALAFLHSKFVIHRDLKAGNVLITADGSVKLADFGVSARNTDEKQRRDTFIGTPFWMAPEVIVCETMKDNPYDYRADVWSLGITLIELAEMNPPLHEMHPMRVMIKVQRADPPKLRNPKKWSPQFSAFLNRCLVKNPLQRTSSSGLLEDVFIREMTDTKPIRQLVGELSAEVIETIEEGVNLNALNESSISLGSLDRLDDKEDDRASRGSSNSPAVSVVVPTPAPPVEDSVLCEEMFHSVLEEVLGSVTDVPSVASVVLDVMNDEMQALMQQEEEQEVSVVTTDIDAIIVADNRTHDPAPQPQIPNGKATPVRVGSGYGTVSTVVSPSTDDNQNLVVRDNRSEGKEEAESSTSGSAASATAKEDSNDKVTGRRRQSHFRTLTRVRKFVVDGEEVTTTTSRVVVEGKETQHEEEYVNRKQGIREMMLLQKQEQRQHRDLVLRSQMQKDELDVRLRMEETNLKRQYDADLDALQRQQKVQLERAEVEHTNEIRFSSRRIKTTQEREFRSFRDLLKQELKGVKQGLDTFPKDQRKDVLKQRMEEKDLEHVEREREFQNKLAAQMSAEIDRMTVKHRRKLGQLENGFLRSRHKLRRRFEETRWELEESQMHLRHQKAREQLEEYFSLKRTQTAHRQGVEKEHLAAMLTKEKEFTLAAQAAEKKRFPKQLRMDRKARMQMFRQSLRVPGANLSSDEEKEKIRAFEEQETERVRFETERLMKKQSNKLAAMNLTHETMQRELEQLQAEKTKELMDQETGKLREIDDAFRKNLTQYRENLKERRQNLEKELQEELHRQEEFYTQSDDGPNVQIRELSDGTSQVTDLDRMPYR